jgi:pimeloyl-ACP methyl ester carboxylesterase
MPTDATLVLLTPIGLDARCWDAVDLPDVPTRRHEFPGFGSRARAAEQPTMQSLADEVLELAEGTIDVAGISMGGMVAQHVALRDPARVRSLLVACTGAAVDPAVMAARAEAADAQGMADVLEETLARWFTPPALAEPAHPGVAYAREALLALDPRCFADGWRAIATHDTRARLAELRLPTTCLAGRGDPVGTPERVQALADGIPGSRFVVIDGPHMIQLEEPAAFAAALGEHLARVEDG